MSKNDMSREELIVEIMRKLVKLGFVELIEEPTESESAHVIDVDFDDERAV